MEPLSRGIAGAINPLQGDIEALLGEKTVHQGLQLVGVHVETLEGCDDPDRGLQERLATAPLLDMRDRGLGQPIGGHEAKDKFGLVWFADQRFQVIGDFGLIDGHDGPWCSTAMPHPRLGGQRSDSIGCYGKPLILQETIPRASKSMLYLESEAMTQ